MTAHAIRIATLLAAPAIAAALLAGAGGSRASTGAGETTGCRGLSPASAVDCPSSVFAP